MQCVEDYICLLTKYLDMWRPVYKIMLKHLCQNRIQIGGAPGDFQLAPMFFICSTMVLTGKSRSNKTHKKKQRLTFLDFLDFVMVLRKSLISYHSSVNQLGSKNVGATVSPETATEHIAANGHPKRAPRIINRHKSGAQLQTRHQRNTPLTLEII